MGIKIEQWLQKIEDRIKWQISTPFQAHQSDYKKRDSKPDETTKLDKATTSHIQPEEGHTEMRIAEPGFVRHEECIDEVKVKINESQWKVELWKMRAQIQGMRNNICKGAED